MTRPVVGITTWKRGVSSVLGPGQPAHTLGVEYAAAVERAGATVVLLPPTPGGADVLDRLDGLVLSGGEDVRPERYGGIPQPDIEYDDARDAHEITLVTAAKARRLPTLAICRGMQLLNVALGGDLVADLPHTDAHVRQPHSPAAERHTVSLDPQSGLAKLYCTTTRTVNSLHHQAVGRLAPGYRVVARTADGVAEAIESDDEWPHWALQWHPEKLLEPAEQREERVLFDAFVAAASQYAAHGHDIPQSERTP